MQAQRIVTVLAVGAAALVPAQVAGASGPPASDPGHSGSHPQPNPPRGGSSNGGGDNGQQGAHGPDSLPPEASPVAGERVDVATSSGSVRVRLPNSASYVALEHLSGIPVGSQVDATQGVVTLTSARGTGTQTGDFWGGVFRIQQSRSGQTELVLSGPLPACPSWRSRTAVHSARATVRRLWGRDHGGSFRTRGRYGAATVRGTVWLTQDRCDGTLVTVKRGAVVVRDFRRHRNVRVRAGHSYLARR